MSFTDAEEEDGVYTVTAFTCVYQYEEMTLAVEVWFYDVEGTDDPAAEFEALISGFMAVTVTTSGSN